MQHVVMAGSNGAEAALARWLWAGALVLAALHAAEAARGGAASCSEGSGKRAPHAS